MSAELADILTSLYALRSQAGVVRLHSERARDLALGAKLAGIQEQINELIDARAATEARELVSEAEADLKSRAQHEARHS